MTGDEDRKPNEEGDSGQRWPIGFMLLVGAIALYLGWRLVQGIGVLVGWISG
ncbi:MAG: hypothetical protein WBN35_04990 [Acidimicrobiia bacterium]|jgi:hypothetical protein